MNQNIQSTLVKNVIAMALFCLLISFITLAKANPTILLMGDSLSAEYGLQRGSGWAKILERQLQDQGSPWSIFNASISGETTAGGLSRLPKLLTQEKPGIVMIELGANDALRGLSITQTESNLRKMIALSKLSGARVMLFGMQIPPNYGQDYARKFKDIYPRLAAQENIELIPFFLAGVATQRDLFQADNIHPNEKAQILLYKNVWGAMAPYQSLLHQR
ncbi:MULTISPECIES: arylesterase [unclassified Polynucleobacter]|jgi:acyl-CoA thioesterase-1|uniref:arylesterase n=1 Tax=unclassified Polynucleobacter TaxID=2640945 RepID=UPI001BFD4787|nr:MULTISPECIES: arylesterase [unclassified Polynucleobacter]MBU3606748.1 arylesterase [Polynucleobacter sp. MWH-Creno-3A4]QWD78799.1 arylesterase [Polynucleobacter sp. MWH-Svant-W18]